MSDVGSSSVPPRVGLTTYRETASWGVWHTDADLLPANYADAVASAGGIPVLLPPAIGGQRSERAARIALAGVAGVIVSGGPDVDPSRYGAERDPATGPPRDGRDEWELEIVRVALAERVPLLAICRGMQVLNVALGGTLTQHLPDLLGHSEHCPVVGEHARHDVQLAAGSRLASMIGEQLSVATYHHQGVAELGADLEATGWASDGLIEAVEYVGGGWAIGVQWHPEAYAGASLFTAFVSACAAASAVASAADDVAASRVG